eukprot:jgi/Psemu1/47830/gm1.47830_g
MENNKGRSERAERAQRRQNNKDAERQRAERAERAQRRSQSKKDCAGRQQQADKDVTPEIQVEREFQLSEDIVGPPENFGLSTGNTVGLEVEQLDNAVDQPDITVEDKKRNKTDDIDDEVSSTSSSSSSSDSSGSDSDSHSDDSSETVYYTTAYGSGTKSDSDESKLKGIQGATIEMATTAFDLYL